MPTCPQILAYESYYLNLADYYDQQAAAARETAEDWHEMGEAQGCYGSTASTEPPTDVPDDFADLQKELDAVARKFTDKHSKPSPPTPDEPGPA